MTITLAIIAVLVSLAALGVATWNARSDTRSAIAAEDSAVSARQSADHARESAESAAHAVRTELNREHRTLEPGINGQFGFTKNPVSPHMETLVYKFKLDSNYTVKARLTADQGNAFHEAVVIPPERVDGDWRVIVEEWTKSNRRGADRRKRSDWDRLELRFWPPVHVEGHPSPWTCGCGRSMAADDGPGHWHWILPVDPPTAPRVVVV